MLSGPSVSPYFDFANLVTLNYEEAYEEDKSLLTSSFTLMTIG